MFLIRDAESGDLDDLFKMSKLGVFLNLPQNRSMLSEKLQRSKQSFSAKLKDPLHAEYCLVLEDLQKAQIVGSCTILAKSGTPEEPNIVFRVLSKKKYSKSLHMGFLHEVLRLEFDFDGPSEIGGLVLKPEYRRHQEKLGRFLSFVRFAYIAARRHLFTDTIHTEFQPPFDEQGNSLIWEEIGRKFTNLSYDEADRLSRKNKEFTTALFPEGDIYTCMLSASARSSIGQVGPESQGAQAMLESLGFKYKKMIDPFDGGPHYGASTDQIKPIRNTRLVTVADPTEIKSAKNPAGKEGLVLHLRDNHLRALQGKFSFVARNKIAFTGEQKEALKVKKNSEIYFLGWEKK